jgi:hypothetical protein
MTPSRSHGARACGWENPAGVGQKRLDGGDGCSQGGYNQLQQRLARPGEAVARSAAALAQLERITELFSLRICARILCRLQLHSTECIAAAPIIISSTLGSPKCSSQSTHALHPLFLPVSITLDKASEHTLSSRSNATQSAEFVDIYSLILILSREIPSGNLKLGSDTGRTLSGQSRGPRVARNSL